MKADCLMAVRPGECPAMGSPQVGERVAGLAPPLNFQALQGQQRDGRLGRVCNVTVTSPRVRRVIVKVSGEFAPSNARAYADARAKSAGKEI
jgi:hypothetical protein